MISETLKTPGSRPAIVYNSFHHGNTASLAAVLAEELSADLFTAEEARSVDGRARELVGIGSGIYFGRHDRSLLRLVDDWDHPPRNVFIFSTAGLPFLSRWQHGALRRRLRRRGCRVVDEFSCRGWDTVGPLWLMGGINRKHPDGADLERLRRFARQLPPGGN